MLDQIASGDSYQIDEQGWLDTILSVPVNGTVRINTMDWLGQSQFLNVDVFWPVFSDAISKVPTLTLILSPVGTFIGGF